MGAPGLAGAALSEALRQRSLFVYCGHGAGQQHLPGRTLRRQRACAASLLMGCSSGRLARSGQHYEPSGPILAYLLAGVFMRLQCQSHKLVRHVCMMLCS